MCKGRNVTDKNVTCNYEDVHDILSFQLLGQGENA